MNKKIKLGISAFSGYGAAGLIHRLHRAVRPDGGSMVLDAGIMVFEALVFLGVTAYANTVIGAIDEAIDKSKEDEKEEGDTDGNE